MLDITNIFLLHKNISCVEQFEIMLIYVGTNSKVWWLLPLFLFVLSFSVSYILLSHSYSTFIHLHSPRPLSIFSLLAAKPPLGCRSEIRTRAFHTAGQRTEPYWATLQPTELRCILLSFASPYWATLHPTELRFSLLSYVAPYWAAVHPSELHCTLLRVCYFCYFQNSFIA